jgi:hypothetical protein
MWKPWYHNGMCVHGLLQGWLNLLTVCAKESFSRCLFIFVVSYLEIWPNPVLVVTFCNRLIFCSEGLIAPRPTPKLEARFLSAVHRCLFNLLQLPSIPGGCLLRPHPEDAPCHGDKVNVFSVNLPRLRLVLRSSAAHRNLKWAFPFIRNVCVECSQLCTVTCWEYSDHNRRLKKTV